MNSLLAWIGEELLYQHHFILFSLRPKSASAAAAQITFLLLRLCLSQLTKLLVNIMRSILMEFSGVSFKGCSLLKLLLIPVFIRDNCQPQAYKLRNNYFIRPQPYPVRKKLLTRGMVGEIAATCKPLCCKKNFFSIYHACWAQLYLLPMFSWERGSPVPSTNSTVIKRPHPY